MRIAIDAIHDRFRASQRGKASNHTAENRIKPSLLQYDYLALSTLADSMKALVNALPVAGLGSVALDVGSQHSPYRPLLEAKGYEVRTLDLGRARTKKAASLGGFVGSGLDYSVTAEA